MERVENHLPRETWEDLVQWALLIRNGTVVTADKTFAADVLIEGETIKEVRPGIPGRARP